MWVLAVVPIKIDKLKKISKIKSKKNQWTYEEIRKIYKKWCNYWKKITFWDGVSIAGVSCKRVVDRKSWKNIKITWDYFKKINERLDHVMKFKFLNKLEGKFYDWWHSLNEMKKWDYKLKITHNSSKPHYNSDWTRNTKDYPYSWIVEVKDEKWNFIKKSWNSWSSSFFPDSWDRKRIAEEVKFAVENNKGLVDKKFPEKWVYWKSKDWSFNIQIQMDIKTWKISSFFPIFDKNLK